MTMHARLTSAFDMPEEQEQDPLLNEQHEFESESKRDTAYHHNLEYAVELNTVYATTRIRLEEPP